MKTIKLLLIIILLTAQLFSCASAGENEVNDETKEPAVTISPPEHEALKKDEEPRALPSFSAEEEELKAADDSDYGFRMEKSAGAVPTSSSVAEAVTLTNAPGTSGLKAGYADDNRQFGYFLRFLEEYRKDVTPLGFDVNERIVLKLNDVDGKSIPGAKVSVSAAGKNVSGFTLADGSWQIYPSELFDRISDGDVIKLKIAGGRAAPDFEQSIVIDRKGERYIELKAGIARKLQTPLPVDIVFVMDTTGSMGEEINRLKNTIQIIHMNLTSMKVAAEVRFGMVLYKDIGDDYRTQLIPLTSDMDFFQAALDRVQAYGGGDTPEDLEAALGELVNSMDWNPDAVKLSYVITDAPPHLDYQNPYSCEDAVRKARASGIKIFTIGTGGLDIQGEYNLRQIAQYTSARYIFLTYGEDTGDSDGGAPGSVSHHTGSNWSADKLESIVIRFTREELSYLSDSPLFDELPWFEADKIASEKAEETLSNLFEQAIDQLLDFSTVPLTDENLLAVLPFSFEGDIAASAEYFNEHLILTAGGNEKIKLAERKDIAQLLSEIEFQNTGITDETNVSRIGEFLNADILLAGNLFMKDGRYELFLKLVRVETAEILAVTRAVIDSELGL